MSSAGTASPESATQKPWREGKDGAVIVNWDYASTDGETLRDRKLRWTEEFTEERGAAWVAESQARLDAEFEMMVKLGLLT